MMTAEYQKVRLVLSYLIDDRLYLFSPNHQPLNVEPGRRCLRHRAFLQLPVIGAALIEKHLSPTG